MKKKLWALAAATGLTSAMGVAVGAATPANAAILSCSVTSENPHLSTGANSVIFKTRITCNIPAAISFNGSLYKGPLIGPGVIVAATHQTRAQNAGTTYTYYTPNVGEPSVACVSGAHYWGYVSVTGTAANGVTDSTTLSTYHVTAC